MTKPAALPLFLQALGLVIATLVVCQTLAALVILNLPGPPPPVYTVAEVLQAIHGQHEADTRSGTVLMTSLADRPPSGLTDGRRREHFRDALARATGLDPAAVVVAQSGPPPSLLAMGATPRRVAQQRELLRDAPEPLLIGRFKIGVRRPDGRWLIVRPRTTFGIDPWQERLALVLALSVLAVAPLAWMFSRRIAAPIAALAAGAERLGRDPQAPPLEIRGSAEVAAAARSLNDMQSRLRRYVDERVGMLGAIAHDLRTPLTRVRFRIESVPEDLRAKLIADIDQMEAMVASVLGFVRDAGQSQELRKLEIASLVETVMDEAALTGAVAVMDSAERVVVEGDPLALKRLVANLVDNAIKFGASARARVRIEGAEAVVEVEDDGPGVPDGEMERVFEPFRRLETSRSRETGGIGLGLSVARAVARSHGGDVRLSNRPGGGLVAQVRLPRALHAGRGPVAARPSPALAAAESAPV